MRKVILHYHFFKNAGTSIDESLKASFGQQNWVTKEFVDSIENRKAALKGWMESVEEKLCFSTHTADFPVPKPAGCEVFPIVFLRHPIDRIASVYHYERQQNTDSFGATLARNTTFRGYVECRLNMSQDRQCRNFHVNRLAKGVSLKSASERQKANLTFDALPFIGVVEKFNDSLAKLEIDLKKFGIGEVSLAAHKMNVGRTLELDTAGKLAMIKEQLGHEMYDRLLEANADDIGLYQHALSRYET
ncbi:MAG: hypothetical protein AAGE59_26515 [Cyanobacteria bacterium P01_F01_bin.86]